MKENLDITWVCILYPGNIEEELISTMADAGCREVSLGFESGCEKILAIMNKKYTLSEVRRTSELLVKYKIKQMGFLLLGGPGETRETVEESLTFADSLPLDAHEDQYRHPHLSPYGTRPNRNCRRIDFTGR